MSSHFSCSIPGVVLEDHDALRFPLGTEVEIRLSIGTTRAALKAVYIKAEANLSANLLYELPLIGGTDAYEVDTVVTTTSAAVAADTQNDSFACCVPLHSIANNYYGWAAVSGLIPLTVAASAAKGARLYTTATNGVVDDTDTDYILVGAYTQVLVGGSAAVTPVFCENRLTIFREAA